MPQDVNEAEPRGDGPDALAGFASDVLDWPAVRELLRAYSPSALSTRALMGLAPLDDDEARAALARTAELLRLASREGKTAGPPLRGHPDPLPVLTEAKRYKRALGGEDLDAVARMLRASDEASTWLAARGEELPACNAAFALRTDLREALRALRETIEGSIDEKGEVRDDATPMLARLRRECADVAREIERRVSRIAASADLRVVLADGSAGQVQMRNGRPTIAVKAKSRGRVAGIVHDASQSGETVFVEPEQVVELGNRLAAARADAKREEARVLSALTREVLGRFDDLAQLGERLARIELAMLGADYAREVGGRPARLPGDEGASASLLLRGFRHPLLLAEQDAGRIDAVVPIDLRLGDDFDMLVLTGPNTGGKTLALKSAGLAALLTRLGLPLPCDEGTTIPLYDGVAADIGDEQEIQQSLSTFSSHLKRIRAGLARAGERTLFLLDELGGGTDPAEGAALGAAILDELARRSVPTLVSTHLGQLKEFAYRTPRVENGSVEFDLATLAPLYRVMVGLPGESRALAIARRYGMPEAIVKRAEGRVAQRPSEAQELVRDLRDARVDAERMRSSAEERLVELEGRLAALQAERDELARRGETLEAEAQRGVEERVANARPALARARAMLPQLSKAQGATMSDVLDALEEALGGATLSQRRADFLQTLKRDDHVWLPKYKKRVQVVRVKKEKRLVVVRLLRQELEVSFDDVTFYESL